MRRLGLIFTKRKQPFTNVGGHPVSDFQDLTVDGQPLLPKLELVADEHFDVVTALTPDFPAGAVEFLDNLLGSDDRWRQDLGAEPDEVPIYICPIDYDPLCGGIVATVERTDDAVRIHQFRHTSTDESYDQRVSERLRDLNFVFARQEFHQVLGDARDDFAKQALTWERPDWQVSPLQRLVRRLRRRWGR